MRKSIWRVLVESDVYSGLIARHSTHLQGKKLMKRLSVLALLAVVGLLISSITFAQPGDIPAQQPVIHARVESRTVDGVEGQSCWPKTDNSPLCNVLEDPEPTAPVTVFQGQKLTFVIEPDAPAPQKFTAVLLDDATDTTERDLLAAKGEFDFSALKLGRHRIRVVASYPTSDAPNSEYFVTYVFLLQVENPPTPTPTPSPTITPSPTATPLVPRAVLQQSVRTDRTSGVLIFSVQTENEELIKRYRLNFVAASGELKQFVVDTPPYDEISVPFADLPGGAYTVTLSALDDTDKVIAQGSQISFTFQPPTPTATPTEVPTQAPTETSVAAATSEATDEATQAATIVATQAATQPVTQEATAAITMTATPVATQAATVEPTRGTPAVSPQPVTPTATPVQPTPDVPPPLPTDTVVAPITPTPFSPTAPPAPTLPSATPLAVTPATATPTGPSLILLVGGTEFDPIAVTECNAAGQCQSRVLEARVARAISVPGAVSQIAFTGPRPTAVAVNLFTGDAKTVLNTQRLPADNVVLYIMPAAPGNYVLSVELGVPEGTLTYFFRLLVSN